MENQGHLDRAPRIPLAVFSEPLPTILKGPAASMEGVLADISDTGLCILFPPDRPVAADLSAVQGAIVLPVSEVAFEGRLAWLSTRDVEGKPYTAAGIEFTKPPWNAAVLIGFFRLSGQQDRR